MQSIISFIQAHAGALASIGVAILDLVFALNPNANAPDGILHMIYLLIKKASGSSQPPAQ